MAPRVLSSDIKKYRDDNNKNISESEKMQIDPEEVERFAASVVPGTFTFLEGRCLLSHDSPFYKAVVKMYAKQDAKRAARKRDRSGGICKNKGRSLYVEKHNKKKATTSTKTGQN